MKYFMLDIGYRLRRWPFWLAVALGGLVFYQGIMTDIDMEADVLYLYTLTVSFGVFILLAPCISAIDFVSNLFQIGSRAAALKIADKFHIPYNPKGRHGRGKPITPEQKKEWKMRQLQNDFREWRGKVLSDLNSDYRILTEKAERYAPADRDAPFPQAFVQAYNDRTLVEFYIGLLETAPRETQIKLYLRDRAAIAALDDRVNGRGNPRSSVREKLEEKKNLLQTRSNKAVDQHKQRTVI